MTASVQTPLFMTILLDLSLDCMMFHKKPIGPSIYDVHTEGGGGQAQVDACGRGTGVKPHVGVHTGN